MPLETATWISDLVTSNPPGTDLESQGANHLRLIKSVLQSTFPITGKAFNFPSSTGKSANYSVQKADLNVKFIATTSGGAFTFTLPTLAAGDAGWFCEFLKIGSDTNPFFIAPPSGTLQSGEQAGLSTSRRCIPGRVTQAFWTGGAWFLTRVPNVPVGTILPYSMTTVLPIGYEWANGQTLVSAATNYPDYFGLRGAGNTPNCNGRTIIGLDGSGGVTTNLVTVAGGNFDSTSLWNTGGAQNHTLTASEIPAHTHSGTTGTESATHTHNSGVGGAAFNVTAGGIQLLVAGSNNTGTESATHTHGFTTDGGTGGGAAHAQVQPSIAIPMILVVE